WPTTRCSRTNPRRKTAVITPTNKRVTRRNCVIEMMHIRKPGQAGLTRLAGLRVVRGAILVALFSLLPLQQTKAHDPGLSSLTLRARPNGVEATLTLAVRDAAQLADLDDNHDGSVTQAEFAHTRSQLEIAVAEQLVVAPDGKVAKAQFMRSSLDGNNNVEV